MLLSERLPETVNGVTISRYCASSLEAIRQAANSVATGQGVMSGFGREKELPALSSYYRGKCITTRL